MFCPGCGEQVRWATPPTPPTPPKQPVNDRWPSLHALERELGIGEGVATPISTRSPPPLAKALDRGVPSLVAERAPVEKAKAEATRTTPRKVTVAPLWRRVLAWTIDASVLAVILFALLWMGKAMVSHGPPSRLDGLDYVVETLWSYQKLWQPAAILCAVLCAGYLALFTALGGQTPGKRVLSLSVIDRKGASPGLLRSGTRALFALVSGTLMLMGFFLVLVDRRRQALHDKLSGTFVVMTPERG
jgi:uncharacterized RDD family membrane protein YckC